MQQEVSFKPFLSYIDNIFYFFYNYFITLNIEFIGSDYYYAYSYDLDSIGNYSYSML